MKIKDMVEATLKMYPKTREDDRRLAVEIWRRWGGNNVYADEYGYEVVALEDILKLPSQESIGRWRRKFQENGSYLPEDTKITQKRRTHSKTWKVDLGYRPPEVAIQDGKVEQHLKSISQEVLL